MSLKRVARIKIFFDVFGAIKIGINFDRACNCFSPFLSIPVEQKITGFLYSLKNLILLFNCFELEKSIKEMVRVSKKNKYLCVESYRNEYEKTNLLYWQVTCEAFNNPEEWKWWFKKCNYDGNYSFIFFE